MLHPGAGGARGDCCAERIDDSSWSAAASNVWTLSPTVPAPGGSRRPREELPAGPRRSAQPPASAELRAGSAQPCHLPKSRVAISIRNCGAGCDCQLQIQSYTRTWFQAGNRSEVNPPEALGESGDNFLHMQKETSNTKLVKFIKKLGGHFGH